VPIVILDPKTEKSMAATQIYRVRDNGRRSFIPPCFCWDVAAVSGQEETVVSELDLSPLHLDESEEQALRTRLSRGEVLVQGYVADAGIPPGGLEAGRKLVVASLRDEENGRPPAITG
jgi:hypothetical protein